MPGPVFLRGDDVTLHPVEEEDLPFLQRLVNHPDVRRDLGMTAPSNAAQSEDWWENSNESDDQLPFVVTDDEERVGHVNLHVRDHWDATVGGIAYYVDPDHWGNGYATDATRTACDYALHERGFDKVTGQVYVHNEASRRVLEKVGFEREGVHRDEAFLDGEFVDVAYYGLLPADFEG
jgi:RimJ/RimL family protein N-acetyltransferase